MKTATDTPDNGRITVKTTETRVIAADSDPLRKTPDFWTYLESLTPADWEKHLLYVYRKTAEVGPMVMLEKSTGYMAMPGGIQVALKDREEFEFAMQQKYGGGHYHLIMKRGSERVSIGKMLIEGAPKSTQPGIFADNPAAGSGPTVAPAGDPSSDVAKTAMNLVANHEAEAVNVAIGALRGAADVVQRFSGAAGGGGGVNDQILQLLIARALAPPPPPPDPIESLAKIIGVFQTLSGVMNPTAAQNPLVAKIIDTALERSLNPVPAGAATSTSAALVSTLPSIASHVSEALQNWRGGMEAQRDIVLRSQQPQLPPGAPGAPAPRPQIVPPPPQQNPEGQAMAGPPLEFIETKIVEILREPISSDEAADEVCAFLDRLEPRLVSHLYGMGEAGLLNLFQTRPVLQPAMSNVPRLQEFIRAFLKYAKPADPTTGTDVAVPVKPN